MPLSDRQRAWLAAVTGDDVAQWPETAAAKEDARGRVGAQLSLLREQLSSGLHVTLKTSGGKDALTTRSDDGDADKEVDVDHALDAKKMQSLASIDPTAHKAMNAAFERILALQADMEAARGPDGAPLFSDKEIMDELWTPLVRERIVSENLVPEQYSKIQQVFAASMDLYEKRLDRMATSSSTVSALLDGLGASKTAIDAAAKIAKPLVELVVDEDDAALGTALIDGIALALIAGTSAMESVLQKSVTACLSDIGPSLVWGIGFAAQMSSDLEDVEALLSDIATAAGQLWSARLKPVTIAKKLAQRDVDGALACVGDWVSEAMGMADATVNGVFTEAGEDIQALLQSSWTSQDKAAILDKIENNEPLDAVLGPILDRNVRAAFQNPRIAKTLSDPGGLDAEKAETRAALIEKAQDEALAAEIEQSAQDFRQALVFSVGGDSGEVDEDARQALMAQYDIEAMIRQIEVDRKILKAAELLFSGAAKVASKAAGEAVPFIAAASAGKDFLKAAIAAARRAIELNTWMNMAQDAAGASSVYAQAMKNRVKNLKIQLANHTLEMIIQSAKMLGEMTTAVAPDPSGTAQAVGQVVAKTASAASVARKVILEQGLELEARRQWKLFQKAQANPKDRKLARKVLRGNPTLSKYALAWGAVEDNDPFAVEAMRRCGLDARTLAAPKTNVNNVQRYLEVKFADDPKVLKPLPAKPSWSPDLPVALTVDSWMGLKASAGADRSLPLDVRRPDIGQVDRGFSLLAGAGPEGRVEALEVLHAALQGCAPQTPAGAPHPGMAEVVASLAEMATFAQKQAEASP